MKIHQIYTQNQLRNFTYIIELDNTFAYVIDPWDAQQVNDFLQKKQLNLKAIINTHEHWDHTQGNEKLVEQHQCEVWAHAKGKGIIPLQSRFLKNDDKLDLDAQSYLQVIDAPGHCQAHLCFIIYHNNNAKAIFTGDILFNAGVGNCHNGGDVEDLYTTISNKIATLDDAIQIYPGHEYLQNNLEFTLNREPSNKIAKIWLEKYKKTTIADPSLITTVADEKQINTFLRLDNKEIRENLAINSTNDKNVFIALRALRDKW